ncbi:hypothetical protein OC835_005823 [Tilletia horrida]|nr:hypothetical protein OC835_005823 [Tilletia horrida]
MKDWIRSPSPGGHDRPSATAPSATASSSSSSSKDAFDFVDLSTESGRAALFGIRRGVVGVNLPSGTRAAGTGGTSSSSSSSAAAANGATIAGAGTGAGDAAGLVRVPPSLRSLCLSIVFRNLHQVRDLGFMSFAVAKPILEQCQADQLAEILDHSPHLGPDADMLWKRLCFNDFSQIRKDAEGGRLQQPESWRKLYWRTVSEAEEHKAAVAERIKSRYASARAEKDDRKIVVSERPLIRLGGSSSSSSAPSGRWTTGMYGVSNGGLGGNGRPGANMQGQGMLARAAGKVRRTGVGIPSIGGSIGSKGPGMLAAGQKRKAGPINFANGSSSSIGGGGDHAVGRSVDLGDMAFLHAHKVKLAASSGTGASRSPAAAKFVSPPRNGANHGTSNDGSPSMARRESAGGTPSTSTTSTTRIVKTVVPSAAKAVPPGGLDFFGNGTASSKSTAGSKTKKAAPTGMRSINHSSSSHGAGKLWSPPLSSPPAAVVTTTRIVTVSSAPRSAAGSSAGSPPSSRGIHPSSAANGMTTGRRIGVGEGGGQMRRQVSTGGGGDGSSSSSSTGGGSSGGGGGRHGNNDVRPSRRITVRGAVD